MGDLPVLSLYVFSNFVMAILARSMLAANLDLMLESSISILKFTLESISFTECSDSVSQDSPDRFPSSSESESLSSHNSPSSLSYSPIWKVKTSSENNENSLNPIRSN